DDARSPDRVGPIRTAPSVVPIHPFIEISHPDGAGRSCAEVFNPVAECRLQQLISLLVVDGRVVLGARLGPAASRSCDQHAIAGEKLSDGMCDRKIPYPTDDTVVRAVHGHERRGVATTRPYRHHPSRGCDGSADQPESGLWRSKPPSRLQGCDRLVGRMTAHHRPPPPTPNCQPDPATRQASHNNAIPVTLRWELSAPRWVARKVVLVELHGS